MLRQNPCPDNLCPDKVAEKRVDLAVAYVQRLSISVRQWIKTKRLLCGTDSRSARLLNRRHLMSKNTPYVRCNAKSKQTGEQCKRPVIAGTTKCYHHGGMSLRGTASPTFKTGQYSKFLPTRLLSTYQQTLSDPKLWELNEKAALVNSRLVELVEKLDTGETGETWKALRAAFKNLRKAINEGNPTEMIMLLGVIENLIESGSKDYLAWSEIVELISVYKGLSESERRHNENMERMITAEQMMLMFAAVTDLVRQNVSDRDALHAISVGIDKLITVNHE